MDKIPKGIYCYDENGVCPYWSRTDEYNDHENGYCQFLQLGDWMENGTSLLWDQVKEYRVNEDLEEDEL